MHKRTLMIGVFALVWSLGLHTAMYADFIAKTSTVHTSTGGATSLADVNLINGHTSLGALFINNVTTNSVSFAGTASAVAVGSNLLASYGFRTGGGAGAVYNPSGAPSQPIVAVFALSGTVASGGGNVFVATGGRVGFFSISGTLASNSYDRFSPLTWGATDATGATLLTPIAVWDLKLAESVSDLGDVVGGGGPGLFNLGSAKVNQISLNAVVVTANQGFFVLKESTTYTGATLSGNSFITVTGNIPIVPAGSVLIDEGLVSRTDGSLLVATAANTAAVSSGAGLAALNTIANSLGGLGAPGSAFATGFGAIGGTAGPSSSFSPSNGDKTPNTADGIFTLGVTASPGVQIPSTAGSLLSDLLDAVTGVGPGKSLAGKIEAALNALQAGSTANACSNLNAFIHEVQAQSGKSLSAAQANQFISAANNIKSLLGC